MARILVGALLLSSMIAGTPAHAVSGCEKVATGLPGGGNCRYVAEGPGVFVVSTISGFRVQYLRPGTNIWKTVDAQTAVPNSPASGVAAKIGEIPTMAGDLVDVGIGTASMCCVPTTGAPVFYQDGFIAAHDVPS